MTFNNILMQYHLESKITNNNYCLCRREVNKKIQG